MRKSKASISLSPRCLRAVDIQFGERRIGEEGVIEDISQGKIHRLHRETALHIGRIRSRINDLFHFSKALAILAVQKKHLGDLVGGV